MYRMPDCGDRLQLATLCAFSSGNFIYNLQSLCLIDEDSANFSQCLRWIGCKCVLFLDLDLWYIHKSCMRLIGQLLTLSAALDLEIYPLYISKPCCVFICFTQYQIWFLFPTIRIDLELHLIKNWVNTPCHRYAQIWICVQLKIGLLLCFMGFLHRFGFSFYLKIGLILYCQRFYLRLESISNVFYLSKELEILIPPLPTIVLRSGI